jgi:hypothetical protein
MELKDSHTFQRNIMPSSSRLKSILMPPTPHLLLNLEVIGCL